MPAKFPARIVPIVPIKNLARPMDFYRILGFSAHAWHDGDSYAFLIRDQLDIHLRAAQVLPAVGPTSESPAPQKSDKDRNFSLVARVDGQWSLGTSRVATDIPLIPSGVQVLSMHAIVATPRDLLLAKLEKAAAGRSDSGCSIPQTHVYTPDELDTLRCAQEQLHRLASAGFAERQQESEHHWSQFWSRSAVQLGNHDLERIWYHNQYFLACCLKFAQDKFKLPGAFFPLSAYPVPRSDVAGRPVREEPRCDFIFLFSDIARRFSQSSM